MLLEVVGATLVVLGAGDSGLEKEIRVLGIGRCASPGVEEWVCLFAGGVGM